MVNKNINEGGLEEKMRTLKVALVQAEVKYDPNKSYPENDEVNMAHALELLRGITLGSVDVIVFPDSYPCEITLKVEESPLPREAKRLGAYIVAGEMIYEEEKLKHNSTTLISPQGKVIGRQLKHSLGNTEIAAGMVPGKEISVFDVKGVKVGFASSYDMNNCLYFRDIKAKGAELIINPAVMHPGFLDNWGSDILVRSAFDGLPVIAVNIGGMFEDQGMFFGGGGSRVTVPNPKVNVASLKRPLDPEDFIKLQLGPKEEVRVYELKLK